jgi:tetratricopeptide (TPR) repeat protein
MRAIVVLMLLTLPAHAGTDTDGVDPADPPPSRFEDLDAPSDDDAPTERVIPDAAQVLARGNRTLAVRGPEAALPLFREGAQFHPDDAEIRTQLAMCLIQTQDYAAAQRELDRVLTRHPAHPEALWYRAVGLREAGSLRASAAAFTAVIAGLPAGSPQLTKAHWFRANALERLLLDPTAVQTPSDAGLSQAEVDLLLASYDAYVELDPEAVDWPEVARKAAWIRQNRPGKKVKRWIAERPGDPRSQGK